ncbi:hypothetical protein KKC44_01180 [Patescibacteria group bacterium]|nr:hypothetical protein [Patescibacteria group bacterium]MBU2259195.1 hypothetical protein [Patescibacteria group bacterium]
MLIVNCLLVACISSLLAGCGEPELPPLPKGEQIVSGILFPAQLNLVRRGSHVLKQDGIDIYLVESTMVNLRSFEQKTVILKGVLERNTDTSDLPVLVVTEVKSDDSENQTWSYPTLGLTFKAPLEWKAQTTEDGVQFTVEGSPKPVLTIYSEGEDLQLSTGFPVLISGERAVRRIDEETGAESVTIEREGTFLTLLFSANDHPSSQELKQEWLSLLRSIELSFKGTVKPPTGTGASVHCGGSAGILCPDGFYCNVTNLEENIGVCRKQ